MIEIDHEYHGVELRGFLPEEVRDWCIQNYGMPTGEKWYLRLNTIYFREKRDHMMFLMRWG